MPSWQQEHHTARAAARERSKQLDAREVLTLSAMRWLKLLRDEHPGLVQGSDNEMFVIASRVVDVVFGGAA